MNIPKISKKLCNQSVSFVIPSKETDDWGKTLPSNYVQISNVIVQEQTIYSGNANSRVITANAVVFLFADVTDPMPKLSRENVGDKIKYAGKEWTITNIVVNQDPFGNGVYSYELEVL
ncbi:minor capsid protein [Ligilactobacillus apodemi]|uniref:minor capsid protein n=1 Tax=Ligilactobacillus apodemi TaxID=307126 RepID=UPI00214BC1A6|nr:minor capsid protein [Ligilactobacillus apodemi]MCR1902295.1 minor capsid protein [Ligilactobacillus apodemi]